MSTGTVSFVMKGFVQSCFLLYLAISYVSSFCCLPKKWEALEIYLIMSCYNGTTIKTTGSVNASFDGENKKVAYMLDESSPRGFKKQFTLQDYNKKIQYDVSDGKCTKSQIVDPYPTQCVPVYSAVELKSFLDLGNVQIPMTRYYIPHANEARVTVLEKPCTPLSYQISGNIEGVDSVKTSNVYSFAKGIRNSTIFDLPSVCEKAIHKHRGHRHVFELNWFDSFS